MIGENMLTRKSGAKQIQVLSTLQRDEALTRLESPQDIQRFVSDVKDALRTETVETVGKAADWANSVPTALKLLRDVSIVTVVLGLGEAVNSYAFAALTHAFDITNTVVAAGVLAATLAVNAKRNLKIAEERLQNVEEAFHTGKEKVKSELSKEEEKAKGVYERASRWAHILFEVQKPQKPKK